jgi:hypothetical protein
MNCAIQVNFENGTFFAQSDHSVRSLRIFCLHKTVYDIEKFAFIHYLVVIGYSGGACQEECFYKMEGSNPRKSSIWISTSSGDSFYQYFFNGNFLQEKQIEISHSDLKIQSKFIEEMKFFLAYNADSDYFYYRSECEFLREKEFASTTHFPFRILNFLRDVYWPFSTHW